MKKSVKLSLAAILLAVMTLAAALTASADIGPKPTAWIKLENAPETYYIDLLVNYDGQCRNIYEEEETTLDPVMFGVLKNFHLSDDTGDWYCALSHGTHIPLFGSVVPGNDDESRFSYFGLPNEFRIIIVTPDGKTRVSPVVKMSLYQQHFTVDYGTMNTDSPDNVTIGEKDNDITVKEKDDGKTIEGELTITSDEPSVVRSYVLQFLITCSLTLVIEMLWLFIFRMNFKKHWYKLVTVNVVTQLALTAALASLFVNSGHGGLTFIVVFFYEFVVTVVETAAYALWLRGEKMWKRVVYAVSANVLSAVAGGFLLVTLYKLLWT